MFCLFPQFFYIQFLFLDGLLIGCNHLFLLFLTVQMCQKGQTATKESKDE